MHAMDDSNFLFRMAVQFVNQTDRHLFLTGKAGTGKTTFLKYIREHCAKKMAVVAPTGVAAINAGGVTMHSFFQLPFGPYVPALGTEWGPDFTNQHILFKNIRFNSEKRELLRELELLVIDEVSMVRADMLDATDAILRAYRQQPLLPFGGVQLLYVGDLFQLPPVINPPEWEILQGFYQSPFFFDSLVVRQAPPVLIELKKIYRQNEAKFINILDHVRDQRVTAEDLEELHRHYRPEFKGAEKDHYITLTTHNHKANAINQNKLDSLSGKLFEFKGVLTGDFNEKALPAEPVLRLKKGAQVMFTKNDKGEFRRYFNGKIGTISKITEEGIFVRFPEEGPELEVETETWKNIRYHFNRETDRVEEETLGTFKQFPIRLAWAITIHKSQGLTFEKAIVDAGDSFAPGQVYVALSRLTTLEGLVLFSRIPAQAIRSDERVLLFSASGIAENVLEGSLRQDQSSFILRSLIQAFSFEKLAETFRDHAEGYAHRLIPGQQQAIKWARSLQVLLEEQQVIARRFERQLEKLLPTAPDDHYQQLENRISAGAGHFTKALEGILASLADHQTEIRPKQRVKKYLAELSQLETLFSRKLKQLVHTAELARGLATGMDIQGLLNLVGNHQASSQDGREPQEPPAQKEDSRRISLELFNKGNNIAAVARIRGLTPGTVEGHLISFIPTREINIEAIVPKVRMEVILQTIRQAPESPLSLVRAKLGDDYTYNEIRATLAWQAVAKKK